MTTELTLGQAITASQTESADLTALARLLGDADGRDVGVSLATASREDLRVPASAVRALALVVQELAGGRSVLVVPNEKLLTTGQAAAMLQVSRPYLVRLLEQGEIPFETVGSHRRVRAVDVIKYRDRRNAEKRAALRKLIEITAQTPGAYTE